MNINEPFKPRKYSFNDETRLIETLKIAEEKNIKTTLYRSKEDFKFSNITKAYINKPELGIIIRLDLTDDLNSRNISSKKIEETLLFSFLNFSTISSKTTKENKFQSGVFLIYSSIGQDNYLTEKIYVPNIMGDFIFFELKETQRVQLTSSNPKIVSFSGNQNISLFLNFETQNTHLAVDTIDPYKDEYSTLCAIYYKTKEKDPQLERAFSRCGGSFKAKLRSFEYDEKMTTVSRNLRTRDEEKGLILIEVPDINSGWIVLYSSNIYKMASIMKFKNIQLEFNLLESFSDKYDTLQILPIFTYKIPVGALDTVSVSEVSKFIIPEVTQDYNNYFNNLSVGFRLDNNIPPAENLRKYLDEVVSRLIPLSDVHRMHYPEIFKSLEKVNSWSNLDIQKAVPLFKDIKEELNVIEKFNPIIRGTNNGKFSHKLLNGNSDRFRESFITYICKQKIEDRPTFFLDDTGTKTTGIKKAKIILEKGEVSKYSYILNFNNPIYLNLFASKIKLFQIQKLKDTKVEPTAPRLKIRDLNVSSFYEKNYSREKTIIQDGSYRYQHLRDKIELDPSATEPKYIYFEILTGSNKYKNIYLFGGYQTELSQSNKIALFIRILRGTGLRLVGLTTNQIKTLSKSTQKEFVHYEKIINDPKWPQYIKDQNLKIIVENKLLGSSNHTLNRMCSIFSQMTSNNTPYTKKFLIEYLEKIHPFYSKIFLEYINEHLSTRSQDPEKTILFRSCILNTDTNNEYYSLCQRLIPDFKKITEDQKSTISQSDLHKFYKAHELLNLYIIPQIRRYIDERYDYLLYKDKHLNNSTEIIYRVDTTKVGYIRNPDERLQDLHLQNKDELFSQEQKDKVLTGYEKVININNRALNTLFHMKI